MEQLFENEIMVNKVHTIKNQEAETIYNVTGNVGIYQENKSKLNKQLLNKYLQMNLSSSLDKNFNEKKTIIRTQIISEIRQLLKIESKLLLYGNPGVGKSFIVSEIKKEYESIYISTKDRSTKEIYLYLISKLLTKDEIENKELIDIEDIKSELEISMINKKKLFIFDDTEKNLEIVRKINSLELSENKILFISRTSNLKIQDSISKYELKGFTDNEICEFLKINNIKLDTLKLHKLIEASQGNPLYLYYFSQYQITPLPKSLVNFQNALWNEMTSLQKGILTIASVPLSELSFEEIKNSIEELNGKNINIFDFQEELDNLSHLLIKDQGYYSIFHLSLSEYILGIQSEFGVLNHYKKALASIKVKTKDFLEAVYLLLEVPETNLKEIILYPLADIQKLGLLNLGIKVLEKAVQLYNSESTNETKTRGYIYHLLTLFYKDLYMITEAIKANDLSLECFERINDLEALLNAKLFQALDLLESNKEKEACILIEDIKKQIPKEGYFKASLCANLSKFYIDFEDYMEAKKYAELAYIEFQKLKEDFIKIDGIKHSLNNLAISHSFLKGEENLKLSIEYGKLLYDFCLKTNDLRTRASIANLLTMSYRKLHNYEAAHEVCNEAIKLSRYMNSDYLLIMNLINKGNVYKDENNDNEALNCYIEAKQYSLERNILKEEVRALKLILDIYIKCENYLEGIDVAKEFLEKSYDLNIYYRISEAYDVLSEINYYLNEDEWKTYAMESLKILFEAKKYEEVIDTTLKIINVFNAKLTQIEIQFYFELLIKSEAYKKNIGRIMAFIATNNSINFSQKIDLLKLIIEKPDIEGILAREFLLEFVEYIQKNEEEISLNKIMELLEFFLKNMRSEEFNTYFLIVIIGFSKHFNLIIQNKLLETISNLFESFYFRKTLSNELIITISCSKDLKLQIVCEDSSLIERNISIIIGILFKFNIEKILKEMKMLDRRCYTISIDTYSHFINYAPQREAKIIKENKSKVYVTGNDKENGIISFFINDNFQEYISLSGDEGASGLLSILLQLFILMSKVEEDQFVKDSSIELLISLLLPKIKDKDKLLKEKIDLLEIKKDFSYAIEKLC